MKRLPGKSSACFVQVTRPSVCVGAVQVEGVGNAAWLESCFIDSAVALRQSQL
jgi:hypothetical protein